MEITYRQLTRDEAILLRKIDRSETIENVYYYRDGQLVLEKEKKFQCTNEWFQTKNVEPNILPGLYELFDAGGTIYGAFADGEFVGIAALARVASKTARGKRPGARGRRTEEPGLRPVELQLNRQAARLVQIHVIASARNRNRKLHAEAPPVRPAR